MFMEYVPIGISLIKGPLWVGVKVLHVNLAAGVIISAPVPVIIVIILLFSLFGVN